MPSISSVITMTDDFSNTLDKLTNKLGVATSALNGLHKAGEGKIIPNSSMQTEKIDGAISSLKRLAATLITLQGIKSFINLNDELTQSRARIDIINDGLQTTEEIEKLVSESAKRSRSEYTNTIKSVSMLGANAKDAFKSTAEIVKFAELVNKQFVIAGANTITTKQGFLQLTQAMGSGVLRGDELRSVFEACPPIIHNIADYLGVSVGQVRDLAAEGKLTGKIVKASIFAAAEETNKKFETMPFTFSQIWTNFKTTTISAFQPLFRNITKVANSTGVQNFIDKATQAVGRFSITITEVFNKCVVYFQMFANWQGMPVIFDILTNGALALGAAIATVKIGTMAYNAVLMIQKGIMFIAIASKFAYALATKSVISAELKATAATWGFNAAMLANPITWIIGGIAALIAIIIILAMNWDKVKMAALWCWEKIKSAWGSVAPYFQPIIDFVVSIATAFYNFLAPIVSFAIGLIVVQIKFLMSILRFLADIAILAFIAIIEIVKRVGTIFLQVVWGIGECLNLLKDFFVGLWNWIDDFFGGKPSEFLQWGKDCLMGFLNGLKDCFKLITKFISDLCSRMESGIKAYFGIGSPSKLMREYGNFTFAGFNLGLEDQLKNVQGTTLKLGSKIENNSPDSQTLRGGRKFNFGTPDQNNRVVNNSPNIKIEIKNNLNSETDVNKIIRELERQLYETMNNSYQGAY